MAEQHSSNQYHRFIDLTGQRFGRLVVTFRDRLRKHVFWKCRCDCGGSATVAAGNLRSGKQKSCGCLRREQLAAKHFKHGLVNTREYNSWSHMKRRCLNPRNPAFANYGGRGISVCARWIDSFQNFMEDMGPCPPGYTIERINNDGHYEPSNCKWATRKEQNRNRRDTITLIYEGESVTLRDLADRHGMNFDALRYRHENGIVPVIGTSRIDIEERREIKMLYATGNYSQAQLGKIFGISNQSVSNIIRKPENP